MSMEPERTSLAQQHGRQGFVYVLSSPSVRDESGRPLIKIGCTRKHPIQRAKELGSTGVPIPFKVLYYRDYSDSFLAERLLHERFAKYRISDQREFFSVSVSEVIEAMDALPANRKYREELNSTGLIGGQWEEDVPVPVPTPFAELFASFPDDGDGRELTTEERAACRALERKSAGISSD